MGNTALADITRFLRKGGTTHGFRSTFRDWASETTSHDHHVFEAALGHAISSEVEKAYRRGNLLEKRRVLMADWANFVDGAVPAGNVVPLRAGHEKQRKSARGDMASGAFVVGVLLKRGLRHFTRAIFLDTTFKGIH